MIKPTWIQLTACSAMLISSCSAKTNTEAAEAAAAVRSPQGRGSTPAPARGMDDSLKGGLTVAFGLPRLVAENIYQSRSMVAEAVYYATAATGAAQFGRVMSTGTIVVSALGTNYAPSPADR